MDPNNQDQKPAPQSPNPYFGQPFQPPNQGPGSATGANGVQPQAYNPQAIQSPVPSNVVSHNSAKKGPNKLVVIIIAGVALLVIMAAAVFLSGSGNKPKPEPVEKPDATQSQSLQPAQAIDLEQASNAISQDLSSLDDEQDFPTPSLDDKTLGL